MVKKVTQLDAIKKDLTLKQLRFCQEYVIDLNGTQAAIRAGYSEKSAKTTASRSLANDNVQKEIQRLGKRIVKKLELSAESVLSDIKEIKERCMQGTPVMKFNHEEKRMEETGEWEFESGSALKACDMEGKYLKMWSDKTEVEVKLTIEDLVRKGKDDGKESGES